MKQPTVYVTQIPHRRDRETGAFVPTVNISPAAEHGEVEVMMPPQANFYATRDLRSQLWDRLRHYDFAAGDALIALGDPSIIAVACAILGKQHGEFKLLKWDRNVGRYMPSNINVN